MNWVIIGNMCQQNNVLFELLITERTVNLLSSLFHQNQYLTMMGNDSPAWKKNITGRGNFDLGQ